MKYRLFALIASAGLLASAVAFADGHQFGVQGGSSIPSDTFNAQATVGFDVGGFYEYVVEQLGIGAEVRYSSWGASDDIKATLAPDEKFSIAAWNYAGYAAYHLPQMGEALPFLKLSLGWHTLNAKTSSSAGDATLSDTRFGAGLGAGVDVRVQTNMIVGASATYHKVHGAEADYLSLDARIAWPLYIGGVK